MTEGRETIKAYKARLKTMSDEKIKHALTTRALGFDIERETYGVLYARPRHDAILAEYNRRFNVF